MVDRSFPFTKERDEVLAEFQKQIADPDWKSDGEKKGCKIFYKSKYSDKIRLFRFDYTFPIDTESLKNIVFHR